MARILIIDDEQQNRDALIRAFGDENPNWEMYTASNEAEGKVILDQQVAKGEAIDVILTDLVMTNEQSGMNVLQEARRIDPLVMAILFTAKERSLDRYAAFDYGAFDVVEKKYPWHVGSERAKHKGARGTSLSRVVSTNQLSSAILRPWRV